MKSTKTSVTVSLLLLSFSLFAQTKEVAIKNDISTYFDLLGDQKILEALDMVHPELIGMIGKESFVAQYEQLFNSPGMEVTMDDFEIKSVSPVFTHDSKDYALVNYQFLMTFKVDLSNDKDGLLKPLLLSNYKGQFGDENVKLKEPNNYLITTKREMFAVKADGYDSWKILDFEEGMKVLIASFIPEEVFIHFNK